MSGKKKNDQAQPSKAVAKAEQPPTDGDDSGESDNEQQHTMKYLLNSPAYMSAIMRRQVLTEMYKKLPAVVQGRIAMLKNLQLDQLELEAKFYEEVYELETKYQALYQPLQDKRRQVINGEVEPSADEVTPRPGTIRVVEESESELSQKMKEVSIEIRKHLKVNYPADVKGVPDFWLTIFRTTELVSTMIQPHDEPLLKSLVDVKVVYATDMSFSLEFHFAENEYFTNTVLSKQYFLKSKLDAEEPFTFEGPEIYKCTGCTIEWKTGKNVTVKTIKKKQKHKARGAVRTVNKTVPADSFFNFFNPPVATDEDEEDEDDEGALDTHTILSTDYEIGHFLRSRLIPKAVLYYTGDIVDEDDDDDYDEEEEEEEDSDEDDDDDDDAPVPARKIGGLKGGTKENPAECKQQ